MIYTKVGDEVTDIRIDGACYYDGKLIQVHGTVEGQSRLLYISDLKADEEKEIQDVIRAALKTSSQSA
jgi:hypothetical protein